MNVKTKNQLWLWIGGVVVIALYFGPSIRQTLQQVQLMHRVPAKPSPMKKAPVPEISQGVASGTAKTDVSLDTLLGIWQGVGPLPGRDVCNLKLEMRRKTDEPSRISGFPVLVCAPILPGFVRRGKSSENFTLPELSPVSAVLSGIPQNGSIQFSVDKVIGTTGSGCALTSLTVTPFGTDQIAAQWQEGTCQGGRILLRKTGK
jgi:hypothetical protein